MLLVSDNIFSQVGRLDEHLPKHIPFTILSGDKSFLELEDQLKMTQRVTRILDPHKIDADMMYSLLNSISDAVKGLFSFSALSINRNKWNKIILSHFTGMLLKVAWSFLIQFH